MKNRIKELREKKGLSLRDMEIETGVSNATISRLENNFKNLGMELAIKFADYFKVSIDYLIGRSDINTYGYKNEEISAK